MRIKIGQLVGKRCDSLGDGQKLYPILLGELKKHKLVNLDFEGVESVYTPFLTGAFGKLFNYYEKEYIVSHVTLCCISGEILKKINCFLDEKDRLDTDRTHRETLTDLYNDDSIEDFDGP